MFRTEKSTTRKFQWLAGGQFWELPAPFWSESWSWTLWRQTWARRAPRADGAQGSEPEPRSREETDTRGGSVPPSNSSSEWGWKGRTLAHNSAPVYFTGRRCTLRFNLGRVSHLNRDRCRMLFSNYSAYLGCSAHTPCPHLMEGCVRQVFPFCSLIYSKLTMDHLSRVLSDSWRLAWARRFQQGARGLQTSTPRLLLSPFLCHPQNKHLLPKVGSRSSSVCTMGTRCQRKMEFLCFKHAH